MTKKNYDFRSISIFWIVSLIFLLVGGVFAAIAQLAMENYDTYNRATARVAGFEKVEYENYPVSYYVKAEFTADSGKLIAVKKYYTGSNDPGYEEKVRNMANMNKLVVYYNPEDPDSNLDADSYTYNRSDSDETRLYMMITGIVFLSLGGVIVLCAIADLGIYLVRPDSLYSYRSFIKLFSGILGAASFSVPSTFVFPAFLYAYLTRPNGVFSAADVFVGHKNFVLGIIFSSLGMLVDVILIVVIIKSVRGYKNDGYFKTEFNKSFEIK